MMIDIRASMTVSLELGLGYAKTFRWQDSPNLFHYVVSHTCLHGKSTKDFEAQKEHTTRESRLWLRCRDTCSVEYHIDFCFAVSRAQSHRATGPDA
jgi:hypothetical protein